MLQLGAIVVGAAVGAGSVWLWQRLTNSNSKEPEPTPTPAPQVPATQPTTKPTTTDATKPGTTGKLEKSPTGKGTVPKPERAPQRVPSAKEKEKEREDHDNKCANCGNETKAEDTRSHHYPVRHADGGDKTVPVCKDCHTYLHKD